MPLLVQMLLGNMTLYGWGLFSFFAFAENLSIDWGVYSESIGGQALAKDWTRLLKAGKEGTEDELERG